MPTIDRNDSMTWPLGWTPPADNPHARTERERDLAANRARAEQKRTEAIALRHASGRDALDVFVMQWGVGQVTAWLADICAEQAQGSTIDYPEKLDLEFASARFRSVLGSLTQRGMV